MYLNAKFKQAESVEAAVSALREAGFGADDVEIFSAAPVELAPGVLDRPSRMSFAVVCGAPLAGAGMTAFMFYTQLDYPLVTGGMPLNSGWATSVVTFEVGMGGAVLTTLLMFIWEAGLFRGRGRPVPVIPVPEAAAGENIIVLQLRCDGSRLAGAEQCLRDAGADDVSQVVSQNVSNVEAAS